MSVPDEGYSRNALCALNLIPIFERFTVFFFFYHFSRDFVVEWIVLRGFGSMSTDFLYLFTVSEINLTERDRKVQIFKILKVLFFIQFECSFCKVFILKCYWWAIKMCYFIPKRDTNSEVLSVICQQFPLSFTEHRLLFFYWNLTLMGTLDLM